MRKASWAWVLSALVAFVAPAGAQETGKSSSCKGCGKETFGTSITWVGSPSEAANRAKEKEKLVFVLHVSGYFDDPKLT